MFNSWHFPGSIFKYLCVVLILFYYLAPVTFSYCCDIVCCYVCWQHAAIALQIEPDWAYFYLTNTAFILLLNWIHLFVLKLVDASSRALAHTRQDIFISNTIH